MICPASILIYYNVGTYWRLQRVKGYNNNNYRFMLFVNFNIIMIHDVCLFDWSSLFE